MEETRVNKYKEYRSQLIREGAPTLNESRINNSSLNDTLNTQPLPINEVYDTLESEDKEQEGLLLLEKKKTIIKFVFLGFFLLLLLAGVIFLAILAFRK